jgi:SAM-dependent methyltransferase
MIIHKLLFRYFKYRDDAAFYLMQAEDAIRWLEANGINLAPQTRVLDLGCGHGVFGRELKKRGCHVTFADQDNYLYPELKDAPFVRVDIDNDDLAKIGEYDLVVCSNVFEHLAQPDKFLAQCTQMLAKNGRLYLSWTNWLSPFGGHDYALFHYFGPKFGRWIKFKLTGKWSDHVPYAGLYPTFIGSTIRKLKHNPTAKIMKMASRYYTEFSFIVHIPLIREFLAWNCVLLISNQEKDADERK